MHQPKSGDSVGIDEFRDVSGDPMSSSSEVQARLEAAMRRVTNLEREAALRETELAEVKDQLSELSLIDEQTRLHNRRGFFTLAEQELKLVRRQSVRAEVAFIDIDGVVEINETLGPDVAADAIVEAAQVVQANFRGSDVSGRIGEASFAVFIVNPAVDTNIMRERIQTDVDAHNAQSDRKYELSLSIGFVDSWEADDLAGLLAKADEAMYYDKMGKAQPF